MKIHCTNINEYIEVEGGTTLSDIVADIAPQLGFNPICARVNNKTEDLSYAVYFPKQVEFIDDRTESGNRVYTRSLCMMLYKAVTEVAPGEDLKIAHSISRGWYCLLTDKATGEVVRATTEVVDALRECMHRLAAEAIPFVAHESLTSDAIEIFRAEHLLSKVGLLETTHELYTRYYSLGDTYDSYYGPLAPSTAFLKVFDLRVYKEGFLLLPRDMADPSRPVEPIPQEKMYQAFTDYLKFNHVIGVSDIGQLNRAVEHRHTADIINVAEAMHDKYIGKISDEICARGAKIVLLAGPSSSGKTTTAKRLAVQLMTNLMRPKLISLDDYFVDRHHTPLDADGDYDYEHIDALDRKQLNADIEALLAGKEINLPTYSFEAGRRIEKHRPLRLDHNDVLLIEGIHGLNPDLIPAIPQEKVFKIYVSALTTLSIDDHNWIPTTDTRLLRRIVRDNKYRHTTALETIRRWDSVRRGEERWIFPFQENADATFNSSLIFELGVMKEYAEPLLRNVPHDVPEYSVAYRLLRFLGYFTSIPSDQIPMTSLLREFLGGSSFHY